MTTQTTEDYEEGHMIPQSVIDQADPFVSNPSIDDVVLSLSREIYDVVCNGEGSNLAYLDNALKQFADEIIKEARR